MENLSGKIYRHNSDVPLLIVFDFDGVFTDNKVYVSEEGKETVLCSRLDGIGLEKLKVHGWKSLVLSSEKNLVVSKRCEKLKLECIQNVKDKGVSLQAYIKTNQFQGTIIYVGNDENDLPALPFVDYSVAVADATSKYKCAVDYITHTKGGDGAVREICEFLLEKVEEIGNVNKVY